MASNRRLAAILHADVVGYSRLMSADEAGTHAALAACKREVIEPAISAHAGRVVNFAGDAVLAEFASAVNAVAAALALQVRMEDMAATTPPDRRILLRIGINLGDVIGEGTDIFGDGVNVAARLQAFAEPGRICVSGKVRDEVEGKLAADFADAGLKDLKNIPAPVRVYRVSAARGRDPLSNISKQAPTVPQAGQSALTIAVLPFTNMGSDTSQQHFCDGMTEDIITELARVPVLKVASRNASFRFKGPDADIASAARTLGVRFIVEGSVRSIGSRVRITTQLIDAANGAHVWAERYDRPTDDLLEVQDEVVRIIVGTLTGRVQSAAAEIARRKTKEELSAEELALRAEALPWHDAQGLSEALSLIARAKSIDPRCARAWTIEALIGYREWLWKFSAPKSTLEAALDSARRAVQIAPEDFYGQLVLAQCYRYSGEHELAGRHLARASALNPNRPGVISCEADEALYSGRPDVAIAKLEAARAVDPFFEPAWYWSSMLLMQYCDRRYDDALTSMRRISSPASWDWAIAAASHVLLGEDGLGREAKRRALDLAPDISVEAFLVRNPFQHEADKQHLEQGLRRAGLPD